MVSRDLQKTFVCLIDVLGTPDKTRIDPVRLAKGTKVILKPESVKTVESCFVACPCRYTSVVHQPVTPYWSFATVLPVKRIRVFGGAVDVLTCDLQVAGFLQDVGVGDKVGRILGMEVGRETHQRRNQPREPETQPSIGHKRAISQ